jgi:histone H3/H4
MSNQQPQITCHFEGFEFESAPTPQTEIPNVYLLPMGIPPKMLTALQIADEPAQRYVVLTYQTKNCYLEYLWGSHTDSSRVYSTFIHHFSIAIHLIGCELGSDENYPVYGLLVDQEQNQIWLGQYIHLKNFLRTYFEYAYPQPILPSIPPEKIQENLDVFRQKLIQYLNNVPKLSIEEINRKKQTQMRIHEEAIGTIKEYLNQYLPQAVELARKRLREAKNNQDMQTILKLYSLISRLNQPQN